MDGNTLELLKSGVLKPDEYGRLMNTAQESENYTMARIIGKFAGDAVAETARTYGENSRQVQDLKLVSYMANQNSGSDTLAYFDAMAETFERTSNNPAMIGAWSELTSEIVENM